MSVRCEMCNEHGIGSCGYECGAGRDATRALLRDQLAIHAPAVPDYWERVDTRIMPSDYVATMVRRLLNWPYAYADMVLAARDEDDVPGHHQDEPTAQPPVIDLMATLKDSLAKRKGRQ